MIILTLLAVCKITEGSLGWNMVYLSMMKMRTSIKIIDLIRSQGIDLDVLSHMCNIVNSRSFTCDIASTGCICNARVTRFIYNGGGAVTTY